MKKPSGTSMSLRRSLPTGYLRWKRPVFSIALRRKQYRIEYNADTLVSWILIGPFVIYHWRLP